jgi:hypothetical protein
MLDLRPYFNGFHVLIHENYFRPVLVFDSLGPQHNFHDAVHHVTVYNESKAKYKNDILSLYLIVGGYIAVADGRYRVDSPIECVEVLELPI